MNHAEPGTGTQHMIVAEEDPDYTDQDDRLDKSQFRHEGRTWQCGGTYWDTELQDTVRLVKVTHRSSWCHTGEIEEAPLYLHFDAGNHGSSRVPLSEDGVQDRFLPKHNIPFRLP